MKAIELVKITDETDPEELKRKYPDYHRFHYVLDQFDNTHLAATRKYTTSVKFFPLIKGFDLPFRKTKKRKEREIREEIEKSQVSMF